MKAKVNILAKPHPYIFFTLWLDSAWSSKTYQKFSLVPRLSPRGEPGNEATKSSQPLLAFHGCSLVLRPLPPPLWPGNEASMTLLVALCYTEPLQLEVFREDIPCAKFKLNCLLPMHAHNCCILHRLNVCGMQCTSYYIGHLHYNNNY